VQKVFIPNVADTIMRKIGEWFKSRYPTEIVPEYMISMFVTRNRLPNYLSAGGDLADSLSQTSDYVFYVPIVWIPIQVVLANVVISAHILKQDIPAQTDVDGVGIVHRHPLPGNCSPEDCEFNYDQGGAVVADAVWSEVYPFNYHFNCACTYWAGEDSCEVEVYDINDLECRICENGKVPEDWYMKALSEVQLSKIVMMPKYGKEYLEKLFGLDSMFSELL